MIQASQRPGRRRWGLLAGALGGLALAACDTGVEPFVDAADVAEPSALLASEPVITSMRGAGTLGDGRPAGDGIWLQEIELDVGIENGVIGGALDYTDHSVFKDDGNAARLRVGPDEPGTAITTYVQISTTCVEFTGVGRLTNTDELLAFRSQACDNGDGGTMDVFMITVPQRLLTHDQVYTRGPDMLSSGDLIATRVGAAAITITHMNGAGRLGTGEPAGDGVWLRGYQRGPDLLSEGDLVGSVVTD